MATELIIKNSITIDNSASSVWKALVDAVFTRKYMFGCEPVTDWKKGSSLLWKGSYEGQEMVFVKGTIVEIQPERHLAYTTIDPNNPAIPDIPENYTTVTYELEEENGKTVLTVTQGDFSTIAEGEKRYKEVNGNGEGWNPILVQIKDLVEGKE